MAPPSELKRTVCAAAPEAPATAFSFTTRPEFAEEAVTFGFFSAFFGL